MIKPVFGIKNILIFICMFPITFLLIACVVAGFFDFFVALFDPTADWSFLFLPLGCAIFLNYAIPITIGQVIPRYFTCMKAVRRYISFRDLKELLENEEFDPLTIGEFFYDEMTERKKTALKKRLGRKLQVSRNWFYIKGIYFPKKMIAYLFTEHKFRVLSKSLDEVVCIRTVDDKHFYIDLGLISMIIVPHILECKIIPTLEMNDDKLEKYMEEFYERFYKNKNKREDFLHFLTSERMQ